MRLPQTGGCLCGAFRYEVTRAPSLTCTCHCRDCQRLTGSAFSTAIVVAAEAFGLVGTEPRPLRRTAWGQGLGDPSFDAPAEERRRAPRSTGPPDAERAAPLDGGPAGSHAGGENGMGGEEG